MIDDHVSPDNVAGGVPSRIIVMIAVENTESSVAVVRGAHRLLGDRADYFVLNVGESRSSSLSWAAVYPSGMPGVWLPTQNEMIEGDLPDAIQRAEDRASELAQDGSLAAATPIGEVGDPATAIIRAAHEHAVDIVVIGSHQHSWLGRLFSSSVERSLLREADFAVMIVQHG